VGGRSSSAGLIAAFLLHPFSASNTLALICPLAITSCVSGEWGMRLRLTLEVQAEPSEGISWELKSWPQHPICSYPGLKDGGSSRSVSLHETTGTSQTWPKSGALSERCLSLHDPDPTYEQKGLTDHAPVKIHLSLRVPLSPHRSVNFTQAWRPSHS
jgi:hypothetical protein